MIKRNNKGQFAKGNYSGRRFTSGDLQGNTYARNNKPNRTSFAVGITTMEKHPSWKGGIQHNKNDVAYVAIGPNKRVRRPRYVWEQHYGELPKGYLIWHKDGNRLNDDIDNLEAITRAECIARNNKL